MYVTTDDDLSCANEEGGALNQITIISTAIPPLLCVMLHDDT